MDGPNTTHSSDAKDDRFTGRARIQLVNIYTPAHRDLPLPKSLVMLMDPKDLQSMADVNYQVFNPIRQVHVFACIRQ